MEENRELRIETLKRIQEKGMKKREVEQEAYEHMQEEQQLTDELTRELQADLARSVQLARFEEAAKEQLKGQVYQLHGVSFDKQEGMENTGRAFYIGSAFALFFLSLVLTVISGVIHGFEQDVTMYLCLFTVLQGAMLGVEERRIPAMKYGFRFLFYFIFPIELVMFACYETGLEWFALCLPYLVIAALAICGVSMLGYFVFDPYRSARKQIREANSDLKVIHKSAVKGVKTQHKESAAAKKKQEKEEAAEEKRLAKEAAALERKQAKEAAAEEKKKAKEAWKAEKNGLPMKEEPAESSEENSNEPVELIAEEIAEEPAESIADENAVVKTEKSEEVTAKESVEEVAEEKPEKSAENLPAEELLEELPAEDEEDVVEAEIVEFKLGNM